MNDTCKLLTIGQAQSLGRIIAGLRPMGFDPDGQGIHCPNLHAQPHAAGRIDWWLDGDEGLANGSLDREGHGLWWLRRTYAPSLRRV